MIARPPTGDCFELRRRLVADCDQERRRPRVPPDARSEGVAEKGRRPVILEKYVGEIEAMYSRQTPSPEAQEVGAG
jgi:hypothetical protein